MNLLVLKKFNNYFNRKIKKYSTLEEYVNASSASIYISNINFNPADGVNTELVLGKGEVANFFDFEDTSAPDYIVCYTSETVKVDDVETVVNTIKMRWFITDIDRTRVGQYVISLKRDSIVDNFDTLVSCPAYIKKGIVPDDNPLVLNNEGVSVNQVIQEQVPLKDQTGSAWLVGYMAKEFGVDETVSVQIDSENIKYKSIEDIASELGISSTDLAASLTTNRNNPTYIVNGNIDLVSWINYVDNTTLEYKLVATSKDGLNSFPEGSLRLTAHTPTTDCFCREIYVMYSGALNSNKVITGWKNACTASKSDLKSAWTTIVGHPLFTRDVYTRLKYYADNNTLIYKAGTYYVIKIGAVVGPTNTGDLYFGSALGSPFRTMCTSTINYYNQGIDPSTTTHLDDQNRGKVFFNYDELVVNFYLEEVTNSSLVPGLTYTMSTTRNACKDQCFDVFAIPYDNIEIRDTDVIYNGIGENSRELSVQLAQKLVLNNTTYQIYDLQLLPYCPMQDAIGFAGRIELSRLTAGKDYDFIDQRGGTVRETHTQIPSGDYDPDSHTGFVADFAYVFDIPYADVTGYGFTINAAPEGEYHDAMVRKVSWADGAQTEIIFTADIDYLQTADYMNVTVWIEYNSTETVHKSIVIYPKRSSFSVDINQQLSLKDEMKIEANCNNYRLVSPNYQGSFDFNVAKNGGYVDGFIANCTYKPYTPYIRVAPKFSGLYGVNLPKECRGLICGGDFSLGIINSSWEEYQLQNKNYQNIFNREVQSLDVSQEIAKERKLLAGGLAIGAGAIGGGKKGAKIGSAAGPYGTVAGAIVGGAVGAAGAGILASAEMNLTYKQMKEQRDMMFDKFSLQLGNVQALPYTLTKVGAFDIDSMIFPFLEYYTCTDTEKQALRNKIIYEGMSLGIIDMLGNYLLNEGYLQATLIRNEEIIDDNHMLEDIDAELNKGVYL